MTFVLLRFASYGHWIAFSSITKNVSKYYDMPGNKIDLITELSYFIAIPFGIASAYIVETWGLKYDLKIGGILTGVGK